MARPNDSVEPVVIGVSHKTAASGLRDRLFAEEAQLPALVAELRSDALPQVLLLSTCDRVEIQGMAPDFEVAVDAALRFLAVRAGTAVDELLPATYRLRGEVALRHVFSVAASLDSAMIGEPQVLGQVRSAHRIAKAAGTVGAELDRVLQAAYAAAKRVRSETGIAERAVSVAAVAGQLVRDLHGDLQRCTGLILGAGEMGEFLAEHFRQAGMARWAVAHPSRRRAELVAARFAGHFVGIDELEQALARADVVLSALGSGRPAIDAGIVRAALRARRQRPILLIDVAVPRDVDPAVAAVEDAFLYELEDLERLAVAGRAERQAAAESAMRIVEAEAAAFMADRMERQAVPSVLALRRHFETVRAEVLANGSLDAAAATRLLINRLLHDPSEALRRLAGRGEDAAAAEALLRRLFAMGEDAGSGSADDEENDA